MGESRKTVACEACDGEDGDSHPDSRPDDFYQHHSLLIAKDAEIAALRAENEKKAEALRSILHRFRHSRDNQWYVEVRRAFKGTEP